MSSRARTTQSEEATMLMQEKINAPDTLLKLYTWTPLVAKPPHRADERDRIAAIHSAYVCELARWP